MARGAAHTADTAVYLCGSDIAPHFFSAISWRFFVPLRAICARTLLES